AEDGIRDDLVTGVQTCALPIFFHAAIIASQVGDATDAKRWLHKASDLSHLLLPSERNELQNLAGRGAKQNASASPNTQKLFRSRSEERRVGKECRCGDGMYEK